MSNYNVMNINGYRAVIQYDPEIEMFRGEFVGLNGGADFYANNIKDLKKEGLKSLKVFLDACKKRGIEPVKQYSGKFNVRIPPKLHEDVVTTAEAKGISLNKFVEQALDSIVHA